MGPLDVLDFEVIVVIAEDKHCWHIVTSFQQIAAKLPQPGLNFSLGITFGFEVAAEELVNPIQILYMAKTRCLFV